LAAQFEQVLGTQSLGLEPGYEKWARTDSNRRPHGCEPVQTTKRENSVSNVILPELELFKVQCFAKDPWGLICSVAANQPQLTEFIILVDIL
jgi:hypothetical protein